MTLSKNMRITILFFLKKYNKKAATRFPSNSLYVNNKFKPFLV
ncbi:hypothetical protein AB406_1964 [Riemerella anatipestifer]|uniref:Uncharacterized protein n=1 Tax=Riemerella anatipestifer TaxID=34085 RepID=A0A1S7DUV6_RIEAN|nr:hypothetical protein AB406_1964 [Riemerella anatipestifer]